MAEPRYITHEEAWKKADPWQRIRLALREHEIEVRLGEDGNTWTSRNRLLEEIAAYAKAQAKPEANP